ALADAVAADRGHAGLARDVALVARLQLAICRATISALGRVVVVLALLLAGDDPVAARGGDARGADGRADPALLELAVCRAAIAALGVLVVARLGAADGPVAAGDRVDARLAGRRTHPACLEHAGRRAAVE